MLEFMLKLSLIFMNFSLLILSVIYIYINYSFCFSIEVNYIYINLYINYVSIWFIFLMGLILYFLIFLLSKKCVSYTKYFYVLYINVFIYLNVVLIILIEDFMCFMVLFESLIFPICLVSLFFNFNNRFIFAIFYLIIFSSISSIICIIICIIIISHFNTLNLQFFLDIGFFDSMYLSIFIWILLFIMFAIKYPIWPLHVWLPEMHVEVNTEMSVLLASVVLKIGFFGVYKFLFVSCTCISIYFLGFIDSIIILGITFLSTSLIFLSDYKKIIANWSIIHTGIALILLWHNDLLFIGLLLLCNLSHIVSSSFMFITIGYMYDNYGVRIFILMISFFGISLWSSLFLGMFLFNIDFPFMLLFYVDIFILYGLISISFIYIICFYIITISIFLTSIYIYMCLSFYSFIWLDKYLRLDLSINDIHFYMITAIILLMFYYVIYLLF
ncbi:NADH dehydrogenase subunit 4 (mitochondrion) [Trypanosoma rangeli SC58]|uniref:NADH-ubiquinone oxidoreductase chain 4 n=2 Tax=Trypanosoma rangeli TaxID=5698 RepID=A0A088DIG0_TRYRA|nr:NADH dehydrogenase subunit 4 [Trypanosoma rangeli]ESL04767.1 NADH dehydrogenase subunit 4 [Trypanosoma rangeli SC58]